MTHSSQPPKPPRPELLAAYIDGELDPAFATRIEAWLLTDPHACELLDEQYLLSPNHREFWQAVAPSEPSTDKWDQLLNRIEEGLYNPPVVPVPPLAQRQAQPTARPRLRLLAPLTALAVAAALLVSVWFWSFQQPEHTPLRLLSQSSPIVVEPFAVLNEADIEINSVQAEDESALVVGDAVLRQPLVLANIHEFSLDSMQCDDDGMLPDMPMLNGSTRPMIMAPIDSVRD